MCQSVDFLIEAGFKMLFNSMTLLALSIKIISTKRLNKIFNGFCMNRKINNINSYFNLFC